MTALKGTSQKATKENLGRYRLVSPYILVDQPVARNSSSAQENYQILAEDQIGFIPLFPSNRCEFESP